MKQTLSNGAFDPLAEPVVTICALAGTGCAETVATYTRSIGPGAEVITLDPATESFQVNWHTDQFGLSDALNYRIAVSVGEVLLGVADVAVDPNASQFKNLNTSEYIGLVNGRTLPIKFRVEHGIVQPPSCVIPPASLAHWWPGESNGSDLIGGDDGTLVGTVTYAPGVVGQAIRFGNGYFRLSHVYGGSGTSEVTVMAWIQTAQTGPSAWQAIFSSTNSSFVHFQTSAVGGAAVYTDPGSAQFNEIPSFGPTPVGVWRHVALTAKPGEIRIFENGAIISQLNNPFTYITQASDAVLIGNGYAYGRPFPGLVDELQVYDRALSAAEVQQIYAAGSDGVCRP